MARRGKVTMRWTILFALLPAMLLAACSQDRSAVVPMPLDRARKILSKTDLPPVFGSNAPGVEMLNRPTEITWIVRNDGSEFMRYIATLSDAGEGRTRIVLELKGAKAGRAGNVEQRFAENPSIKNLYLVAMEERIASTMQGRPLDMTKIYPALATATVANLGNIRKSLDEAAKASEDLDRAQKHR
jgi:hypothetical protein